MARAIAIRWSWPPDGDCGPVLLSLRRSRLFGGALVRSVTICDFRVSWNFAQNRASRFFRDVQEFRYGRDREERGGGGARATWWFERGEGSGEKANAAAEGGECARGRAGALGEEPKKVKNVFDYA